MSEANPNYTTRRAITLTLPYPPSADRLWLNAGKTLKSVAYRDWLVDAVQMIVPQRPTHVPGPYHINVIARAPDRRRRNSVALERPISDALAQAGVVRHDSPAQSITVEWGGDPVAGGDIVVSIEAAA